MKLTKSLLMALVLLAPMAFAQAQEAISGVAVAPAVAAAEAKTVEGPIAKVVAKKKEIYVQGADKKYEFYFKPETTLSKDGQPAEFATLTEGMKVRVTYKLIGKRMDPVTVEILQ